ncbi:hypothetical protein ERJ75_000781100 [Trypanosoma vivax]|nr:hypothetical protein ERJ75_000781100 [Trypanosoma vivax]
MLLGARPGSGAAMLAEKPLQIAAKPAEADKQLKTCTRELSHSNTTKTLAASSRAAQQAQAIRKPMRSARSANANNMAAKEASSEAQQSAEELNSAADLCTGLPERGPPHPHWNEAEQTCQRARTHSPKAQAARTHGNHWLAALLLATSGCAHITKRHETQT